MPLSPTCQRKANAALSRRGKYATSAYRHVLEACRSVVALNTCFVPPHETGVALYLRPQLYGSSAQLSLTAAEEYTFCVFAVPTGIIHGVSPVKAVIIGDFDRTAPKGSGHAKLGVITLLRSARSTKLSLKAITLGYTLIAPSMQRWMSSVLVAS